MTEQGTETPRTDAAEDRCNNCGIRFVPVDEMAALERDHRFEAERGAKVIREMAKNIPDMERELVALRARLDAPVPADIEAAIQAALNPECDVDELTQLIRTLARRLAEVQERYSSALEDGLRKSKMYNEISERAETAERALEEANERAADEHCRGAELARELTAAQAERDRAVRDAAAWKWGYVYLQDRMDSIGRNGWAHDCDEEICARSADEKGGE